MKIMITAGGIYGASGEIPIGTELDVKEPPAGWAGRYEVVGKKPHPDAVPVTNPAQDDDDERPVRRGRPPKSES